MKLSRFATRILFLALSWSLASSAVHAERQEVDLSGTGWSLQRDLSADWQNEALFSPGTPIEKIAVHPPTGGWEAIGGTAATAVSVPGTVEQFLFRSSGTESKHFPGLTGVSWWTRKIQVPAGLAGKQVRLQFDSVRFRAEVFLNQRLVGYTLVEGVPFDVDLTGQLEEGKTADLAIRITNPGGMWSWEDFLLQKWGNYQVPRSRGFSGITGPVKLAITDVAHVSDIYVQNTPAMRDVNLEVTLANAGQTPLTRDVTIQIAPKDDPAKPVFVKELKAVVLPPGESLQKLQASVPDAKLWDLENPNLYTCSVALRDAGKTLDSASQRFGFRWFAPEGIGADAMLRLNGKRIVLRTAISWGFWGTSGLIPTPELAAKQIDAAKNFGMNMLNFHRAIGQPIVLDQADEKGLLYFEEPGSYVCGTGDPFAEELVREKLLRMIKRDRSHPSLVIYNLINEQWNQYKADTKPELYAIFQNDMEKAHALDPSRVIVLASSWTRKPAGTDDPVKLAMMPFATKQVQQGWWDFHRASGPESWKQEFYKDPANHYGLSRNLSEIVYWGEEGAISSPPRLALIKRDVEKLPQPGWDGEIYLDWYRQFDAYLADKNLRGVFPDVDQFCKMLGEVAIEHQGRKIEDTRICDLNDGYAINGWEAEPYENHSGVVDCFRNPKADPAILAYYNQPLYVAVKCRNEVVRSGSVAVIDFFVVNEKNVTGALKLQVSAADATGKAVFNKEIPVKATGGDVYGELLAENVEVPTSNVTGLWSVRANLVNPEGKTVATGSSPLLVVNWQGAKIAGKGAVYEFGSKCRTFLQKGLNVEAAPYSGELGKLDWIVVARSVSEQASPIPPSAYQTPDGAPGVRVTFFKGNSFANQVSQRVDPGIDFRVMSGAAPDAAIEAGSEYRVRWEGKLVPVTSGTYTIDIGPPREKTRFEIDGRDAKGREMVLQANVPVSFKLDYTPPQGRGNMSLVWRLPVLKKEDPDALLQRAAKDGTTIILLEDSGSWMKLAEKVSSVKCSGEFQVGNNWLGGQYFAIDHPLFKELPVNRSLGSHYESVIDLTGGRTALSVTGEKLVAGAWQSFPMKLGTAVGVVPVGKGRIVFSTLRILRHLDDPVGPSDVARKLLCNYLEFAAAPAPAQPAK